MQKKNVEYYLKNMFENRLENDRKREIVFVSKKKGGSVFFQRKYDATNMWIIFGDLVRPSVCATVTHVYIYRLC